MTEEELKLAKDGEDIEEPKIDSGAEDAELELLGDGDDIEDAQIDDVSGTEDDDKQFINDTDDEDESNDGEDAGEDGERGGKRHNARGMPLRRSKRSRQA